MTALESFLKGVEEKLAKSHREICDLASGKKKFGMSVPVQSYDSDMTLQAPLDDLALLVKIVKEALDQLETDCLYFNNVGLYSEIDRHEESVKRIAALIGGMK